MKGHPTSLPNGETNFYGIICSFSMSMTLLGLDLAKCPHSSVFCFFPLSIYYWAPQVLITKCLISVDGLRTRWGLHPTDDTQAALVQAQWEARCFCRGPLPFLTLSAINILSCSPADCALSGSLPCRALSINLRGRPDSSKGPKHCVQRAEKESSCESPRFYFNYTVCSLSLIG